MIINNIEDGSLPDYLIIGGGPAGITLATQLASKDKNILLIEAGGLEFDEKVQSHYKGEVVGDKYYELDVTRLRYLGGSSNHWGGNCAPLDEYDLKNWPISYKELKNFEIGAKKILNIKNEFIKYEKSIFNSFDLSSIEDGYVNFKDKYLDQIKDSKNINLLLNSSVLSFQPDKTGSRVEYLNIIVNENLKKIKLSSHNKIILACGGIENSRILLWSRELYKGNFLEGLPIGKYWMEHPSGEIGHFISEKNKVESVFKKKNYFLVPSKKFLENEKLNNVRFSIQFWEKTGNETFKHFVKDLVCIAPHFGKKIIESLSNNVVHCLSAIKFSIEQKPDIENSVNLSKSSFDKYDIPRIQLKWNIKDDVFFSLKKSLEKLGQESIEKNIGRVGVDRFVYDQSFKNSKDIFASHHHMGGTIMSKGGDGVVDQDLKVKNVSNLYVIGSSVFPSGGHFNSTFTIIQLTLRLAKHLTT